MTQWTLHYSSMPRRRWLARAWVLEVLELMLAVGMLVAILLMMAVAIVLICYQRWLLAGVSLASIPLVIAGCFEAADVIIRARQRAR